MATNSARSSPEAGEPRVAAALTRAGLANHLRAVIDRYGIGLVVDVGAHRGEYASMLRGLGYSGPIVSYEPVSSTFHELARASEDDPDWLVHQCALGGSDGQAEIHISRCTDFSSLRKLTAYGEATFPEARADDRELVEVRRLDGVLDAHLPQGAGAPILLKIDTQGSDLDVLEGAGGVLDRVAAIQTEVPLRPVYEGVAGLPEVLATLGSHGFALSGVFRVTADHGLRLIEIDCVAVRA